MVRFMWSTGDEGWVTSAMVCCRARDETRELNLEKWKK